MGKTENSFIKTGQMLGPFRIVRRIGKGGMGEVFEAFEDSLERTVALKVLYPHMAADEDFVARFQREAKAAASLDNPNIVSIYSVGEDGPVHYIAMQFVRGATLAQLFSSRGMLKTREALEIVKAVAGALGHAHARRMIHRDIKPENIMITEEGRVIVADFGLARPMDVRTKITQDGLFLGTPQYASPEQCEGLELGPESDLYSLGVVMYEILGGVTPHKADTPLALFRKIISEEPKPLKELNPNLSDTVISIVSRLLAKKKENRFRTADELVRALDAAIAEETAVVSSDTLATPSDNLSRHVTELMQLRAKTELPSEKAASAPTIKRTSEHRILSYKTALAVLVLAAVLAAAYFLKNSFTSGEPDTAVKNIGLGAGTSAGAGPASSAEPVVKKPAYTLLDIWKKNGKFTLVVLDFTYPTGSQDLAWMQAGLADMLITDFSQSNLLTTISREQLRRKMSELGITEKDFSARRGELLSALDADIVLSGMICKVAEDVRIDAKMLDYRSGADLFSQKARGKAEDVLEMVDTLSQGTRSALDETIARLTGQTDVLAFAGDHGSIKDALFKPETKPGAAPGDSAPEPGDGTGGELPVEPEPAPEENRGETTPEKSAIPEGPAENGPDMPAPSPAPPPPPPPKPESGDNKLAAGKTDDKEMQDVEEVVKKLRDEMRKIDKTTYEKAQIIPKKGAQLDEKAKEKIAGILEKLREAGDNSTAMKDILSKSDFGAALDNLAGIGDNSSLGGLIPAGDESARSKNHAKAVELYYRALAVREKKDATPEELAKAAEMVREALAIAPEYAAAAELEEKISSETPAKRNANKK
jgi:serine/threonine protein kinase